MLPSTALFEPLGMKHALLVKDASGTFVGSSYMYATAREWGAVRSTLSPGRRLAGKAYPARWMWASCDSAARGQASAPGPTIDSLPPLDQSPSRESLLFRVLTTDWDQLSQSGFTILVQSDAVPKAARA